MKHKISTSQYAMLVELKDGCKFTHDWPADSRLLVGNGTDGDLDEVVKVCIGQGQNVLARDILLKPDS